jgi:amidase
MNDTAENESMPYEADRSRAFASATALVELLTQRQISSRELLEIYLGRIERLNPALNAIVTLDAERALADADAADRAIAGGQSRGPLHGLPIKDQSRRRRGSRHRRR